MALIKHHCKQNRNGEAQPMHQSMHTAFILILFNKDLPRAYITELEATTQYLQTRQWVKKNTIRVSCRKNTNNAPPTKKTRGITESPYDETEAHICYHGRMRHAPSPPSTADPFSGQRSA
jgi:hypothetical protein